MKPLFIFCLAVTFRWSSVSAQTVLYEENGISLTYEASYVNTINCGTKKLDQYKVTATLRNGSGSSVYRQQSYVRHMNSVEAAGCGGETSADFYVKERWPNGSSEAKRYYVLIPAGSTFPEPLNWKLGEYKLLQN